MEIFTGFIPAGGQGSRLNPRTLSSPKPRLLLGSEKRRVIDDPLEAALQACDYVWVTTNYLAEQVEEHVANFPAVRTLRDNRAIGSAGSLLTHPELAASLEEEGDLLVLPCDHVYEGLSVPDFWRHHRDSEADITLLTTHPKSYGEYVITAGKWAMSIEVQPSPEALSTTGIFIINNNYLLKWIQQQTNADWDGRSLSVYYDIICPAVRDANTRVSSYFLDSNGGYWDDIGTPERYIANNMRRSGGLNVVSAEALIDPSATLDRCIVLGRTVITSDVILKNAIVSMQEGKLLITKSHPRQITIMDQAV